MIKVERGNVVLDIPDIDMQHYLDKGYNVVDDNGNVIKRAVPKDINTLQKAFIENSKEIAELKAKIAELEAMAKQPKEKKVKAPKAEVKPEKE